MVISRRNLLLGAGAAAASVAVAGAAMRYASAQAIDRQTVIFNAIANGGLVRLMQGLGVPAGTAQLLAQGNQHTLDALFGSIPRALPRTDCRAMRSCRGKPSSTSPPVG